MTSNEYPPSSGAGEDSEHREGYQQAWRPPPAEPGTTGYPPAPAFQPHPPQGGDAGYPGQGFPAGQQAYPAQEAYSAPQAYASQQGYPAPQGYAGQQGYPAPQGLAGSQGFAGSQQYPGQQGYQPVQHTQQLPTLDGPPSSDAGAPAEPAKRRRGRTLLLTALLAALVGGGVGGGVVAAVDRNNGGSVNTGLRITNATGAPAAQLDGTIGAAAAKIRPSVVTIEARAGQQSGTGSGVIIRKDGYILTNDHVISVGSGAGDLEVTLADGRTAAAKIVGRDTSDDLAVIKIDLDDLPAATFAKSSSLSVGQTVVAVGAPLGLSDTVTSGIVSNLSRPVRAGDKDQAVFAAVQTDAAINPGNSGGPLVDLNGSVVGINTAIATDGSGGGLQIPGQPPQQSGNIGIGFAIPADEASRIASELIATGKATHAVLGVGVGGPQTGAQSQPGVPLRSVNAGGPASKAGMKVGDIITALDGQRVTTADALIAAVRNHAPGQQVKVTYVRGGKSADVQITLGSADS
ncbi:MAG TPA: trypsin-like peptidase domain-containing protein [Jatrophihabitans sp.]|jgi:putative serine protease PepD|uniref:S1C family serine protease n=1 Tax=Jatrophihabitans sp. TaxID=1932789 RepID=UPI002EEB4D34